MEERRDMIWMNNKVQYYTFKMATKWCQKFGFLRVLHRESMANYQDKSKCLKTPNSLIRGDAKGDLRRMG